MAITTRRTVTGLHPTQGGFAVVEAAGEYMEGPLASLGAVTPLLMLARRCSSAPLLRDLYLECDHCCSWGLLLSWLE